VRDIRGNVETRIAKVRSGEYAAGVLAAAGMKRLGRESDISGYFTTQEMVPAAGQGIVTLECLRGRTDMQEAAEAISHPDTALVARTERGLLQQFGERLDCYSAIAAHGSINNGSLELHVFVSDLEGTSFIETTTAAPVGEAERLIVTTAQGLISRGALDLLPTGASA
jgi:hydroxymethylbilane synthase